MKPLNVAVIRTDRIGEVLLAGMAVDAVRERFPGSNVFFVTSKYSRPIVEGRKGVEEVFTVDTLASESTVANALKLASFLRAKKVDMAIVMNPHKALHLGCFFAGVPVRAGYDRKWGGLLNRKIKDLRDEALKHEVEYTRDLLKVVDIASESACPCLPDLSGDVCVMERVSGFIGSGNSVVAIHAGSSNPAKVWPKEKYASLVSRVCEEPGSKVLLLGAPDEKSVIDDIEGASSGDVVNLAGEIDLKELIAVLSKVDVFVGNDSGPMHMAAASECSVISIFRDTGYGGSPVRWRPWGEGHVVFHETDAPVGIPECDYRPFKEVTVDDVFSAVREKL